MTQMNDMTRNGRVPATDDLETTAEEWVPGPPATTTGKRLREQLADDVWLDELVDRASESGVALGDRGRRRRVGRPP